MTNLQVEWKLPDPILSRDITIVPKGPGEIT